MKTEKQINWKEISGFENRYLMNDSGLIKSFNCRGIEKILSSRIDRAGYYTVRLSKNGKIHTKYLHRLIAENFIANPEEKKFVNHKNGNKLDNSLENLEWVSHSENIKDAYKNGLCNKSKKQTPVIDITTCKEFTSIKEAAEFYTIPYSTFKAYLNGNRKNKTNVRIMQRDREKVAAA